MGGMMKSKEWWSGFGSGVAVVLALATLWVYFYLTPRMKMALELVETHEQTISTQRQKIVTLESNYDQLSKEFLAQVEELGRLRIQGTRDVVKWAECEDDYKKLAAAVRQNQSQLQAGIMPQDVLKLLLSLVF